jgi:hypothetical protein
MKVRKASSRFILHFNRPSPLKREVCVAERCELMDNESSDAAVAKANLAEHLKNIDNACDDTRLSAVEKIRRIKEEIEKAQDCLKRLSL